MKLVTPSTWSDTVRKRRKDRGDLRTALHYLYALELVGGRYYIGITTQPSQRMKSHKEGSGSRWTKLYSPIRLSYVKKLGVVSYGEARRLEEKLTLGTMKKYGVDNVRGGIYLDTELCDFQKNKLAFYLKR